MGELEAPLQEWARGDDGLASVVRQQNDVCIAVYREDPSRVLQDANNEKRIADGGYFDRQLEELIQNAVDASREGGGRIEAVLTHDNLYVANDGEPFSAEGVRSVMASDISAKGEESVGKFGIGFKSVLAITKTPKILSRSVSFAFDGEWASRTLHDQGFASERYPTMRLAKTIDPWLEGARDPVVAELGEWASTIVIAPLAVGHQKVSLRLYDFRPEFILFADHLQRARLRNLAQSDPRILAGGRTSPAQREITRVNEDDGTVRVLVRDMSTGATTESSRWGFARTRHTPSAVASADGGYVAGRSRIELTYALRMPPPTSEDGAFWAFFPTMSFTTLSGIVNAPWKLSDDRRHLLDGAFNEELLREVTPLFVRAVAPFEGSTDVDRIIDAMPLRGKEPRGWADRYINEPFFDAVRSARVLPDMAGRLHAPRHLRWLGDLGAPRLSDNRLPDWHQQWAAHPDAPLDQWVHYSVYSNPERRNKVERLLGGASGGPIETASAIAEWLEVLVRSASAKASAAAIALAARIVREADQLTEPDQRRRLEAGVRAAAIVLLEDGSMVAPTKGRVFVRVAGEEDSEGASYVDSALADFPSVREDLAALGVVVMDRAGQLRGLIRQLREPESVTRRETLWERLWTLVRELPREAGLSILREDFGDRLERYLRVKTAGGAWVGIGEAYLPGGIVPSSGVRDRGFLIDPSFHGHDLDLLKEVGAVDAPFWKPDPPREPWHEDFDQSLTDAFMANVKGGVRPQATALVFEGPRPPWPMQPIAALSDEGRAAATQHLLALGVVPRHVVNV